MLNYIIYINISYSSCSFHIFHFCFVLFCFFFSRVIFALKEGAEVFCSYCVVKVGEFMKLSLMPVRTLSPQVFLAIEDHQQVKIDQHPRKQRLRSKLFVSKQGKENDIYCLGSYHKYLIRFKEQRKKSLAAISPGIPITITNTNH